MDQPHRVPPERPTQVHFPPINLLHLHGRIHIPPGETELNLGAKWVKNEGKVGKVKPKGRGEECECDENWGKKGLNQKEAGGKR